MIEEKIEIEIEDERISIIALVYFDEDEYDNRYSEIIEVSDLEGCEGNTINIIDRHYDILDNFFKKNSLISLI